MDRTHHWLEGVDKMNTMMQPLTIGKLTFAGCGRLNSISGVSLLHAVLPAAGLLQLHSQRSHVRLPLRHCLWWLAGRLDR